MLTFSPALPEDAEILFRLNQELIDAYEDISSIDYPKVLAWVRRNIEEHLPSFTRVYWDGKLAGFYSLSPSGGKWELDSLFVLPPFQNRGIGTAVLQKCQGEMSPLFLYVFRKNTHAIRLYKKLGFRITKEVGRTRYIMEYENQGC